MIELVRVQARFPEVGSIFGRAPALRTNEFVLLPNERWSKGARQRQAKAGCRGPKRMTFASMLQPV